jgi:hypothetical protein
VDIPAKPPPTMATVRGSWQWFAAPAAAAADDDEEEEDSFAVRATVLGGQELVRCGCRILEHEERALVRSPAYRTGLWFSLHVVLVKVLPDQQNATDGGLATQPAVLVLATRKGSGS